LWRRSHRDFGSPLGERNHLRAREFGKARTLMALMALMAQGSLAGTLFPLFVRLCPKRACRKRLSEGHLNLFELFELFEPCPYSKEGKGPRECRASRARGPRRPRRPDRCQSRGATVHSPGATVVGRLVAVRRRGWRVLGGRPGAGRYPAPPVLVTPGRRHLLH